MITSLLLTLIIVAVVFYMWGCFKWPLMMCAHWIVLWLITSTVFVWSWWEGDFRWILFIAVLGYPLLARFSFDTWREKRNETRTSSR